MAFCSKCGTEITGGATFCQACGTPVEGAADQQQAQPDGGAQSGGYEQQGGYAQQNGYEQQNNYSQQSYSQPIHYSSLQQDAQANKVFGILAYIGILVLVTILAAPKESAYSRFHANQGLVLLIAEVGGAIVLGILSAILSAIFAAIHLWGIVGFIFGIVWPVFGLCMLALTIIGIVNAANDQMKPLPVIGKIQILK